jgi:hypothetical protein
MATESKGEVKDTDMQIWLDELYDPSKVSDEELKTFYEAYQYQGFNRSDVLRSLRSLVTDIKEVIQIIIVCALRGPRRAAGTKLLSGRTIESYKIPASGLKGQKGVSCQRITAATADLAASYLKRMNVPKRLPLDCPGWLQFPSAGSIIMPQRFRVVQMDFAKRFSTVIGGVFNEAIYQQMMNNAYLEKRHRVHLFGDEELESTIISTIPPIAPTFQPVLGPSVLPIISITTPTSSPSSSSYSSAPKGTNPPKKGQQ